MGSNQTTIPGRPRNRSSESVSPSEVGSFQDGTNPPMGVAVEAHPARIKAKAAQRKTP